MENVKNLLIEKLYEFYENELVEFIFDPQDNEDDVYIYGNINQLILSPYDAEGTIRVLVMDYDYNELIEKYYNIAELILCILDSFLKVLN